MDVDSPRRNGEDFGDGGSGSDFMGFVKFGEAGNGKQFMDSLREIDKPPMGSLASDLSHKETTPLTEADREEIKKATGWSDEIIDAISSFEEYALYRMLGLEATEVNGKPCLVKTEIDPDQKDELGRTNKERMKNGLPPLDKNGEPIELHHIGQKPNSPLAELSKSEHRGKGNDGILHDKTKGTEIDRVEFSREKAQHWKARAENAQEV